MVKHLPDELLQIICDVLEASRHNNTLYQCAISSPILVVPALKALYRGSRMWAIVRYVPKSQIHSDENSSNICRWGLMWHSIIASTFDRTFLPYYRFLRVLDLGLLENTLLDLRFRGDKDIFFSEGLDVMNSWNSYMNGPKVFLGPRSSVAWDIVEAVGDAITSKDCLFEELNGNIRPEALSRWLPRLSRLQQLTLTQSSCLPKDAGVSIGKHCPNFHQIFINERFLSRPSGQNCCLKNLMQDLPPNTLKSLIVKHLHPDSCPIAQLSTQAESLTAIRLTNVEWDSVASLSVVGHCPNLKDLNLVNASSGNPTPNASDKLAQWICSQPSLETLQLGGIHDMLNVSTTVIIDKRIRLTRLSVEYYPMADSQTLHQALRNQPSLESLTLRSMSYHIRGCPAILLESLCRLTNLKELVLSGVSDNFNSQDISILAAHLPNLEVLMTTGTSFDDSIWEGLSSLPNLDMISIEGLSRFTVDGILNFVSRVKRRPFDLDITKQDDEFDFTDEDKDRIQKAFEHNGRGSFFLETWDHDLYPEYGSSPEISSDSTNDFSDGPFDVDQMDYDPFTGLLYDPFFEFDSDFDPQSDPDSPSEPHSDPGFSNENEAGDSEPAQ